MSYIGVNPNEAVSGGQNVQTVAATSAGVRGEFQSAAAAGEAAAVEQSLPGAYGDYQARWLDKINKIVALTDAAGVNLQAGGNAAIGTDHDAGTGFSNAQASIPPINRPI